MELPTGTIVDNSYRISAPIRLDKNGDVYLGEPIAPGPPVMIHILRTALMEGDPGLEVFERAGLELCRFSHDAFPEVVDYGRFMVRPYLITEHVQAKPLSHAIEAGDISSERALHLVDELRQALHAAHEHGMMHGALSVENVLLTEDGQVKIVDLFVRWVAQQIHSKGAEIDTSADLHALVDISQKLMKSAGVKEVEEAQVLSVAPVDVAADLEVTGAAVAAAQIVAVQQETSTLDLQALAEEEEDAPPALWDEFTPEPEIDMFAAKATVVAPPEALPKPQPSPVVMLSSPTPIILEKPSMSAPIAAPPVEMKPAAAIIASVASNNAPKVRLPPPPASTGVAASAMPKAMFPTPAPRVEAVRTPLKPIQVKLPVPMRVAKPRIESFTPTSAVATASRMHLDDDPFVSTQLQPGYIDFFKRMFPRSGLETKTGNENGASRSFNLLITCSVALLMLAMVLRF